MSEPEQVTETVQTVQNHTDDGLMKRKPWFEIVADQGKWHWCLWSGNGRQMAINCTPYRNVSECKNAIEAFVASLNGKVPRVFVAQDDG